jgi:uncharacterized protein YecT (DUF1311 family)
MLRFLPIAVLFLQSVTSVGQTPVEPSKAQFEALSKSLESAPADQRLAYNALFVAFDSFRDAHVRYEICRGGTGCAARQAAARDRLAWNFLSLARDPVSGAPAITSDDLVADDAALNAVFAKVIAALPVSCPATDTTCVPQQVFRDVQRDWIRYRDALVTYEGLRWPRVAANVWLSYMTRQRTAQIQSAFQP